MDKIYILLLFLIPGSLYSQTFVENQLLIQTTKLLDTPLNQRQFGDHVNQVTLVSKHNNVYLIDLHIGTDLNEQIRALESHDIISFVQRNHFIEYRQEPNDAFWSSQWNMLKISADKVWDLVTGGQTANGDDIVIAIVDDGFQVDHPDFADNIWQNTAEIDGNGVDDDQNGYIDDVYGWNFDTNTAIHSDKEHGTSVAGVAGAKGNNSEGVTGVNYDVKMLLLGGARMESEIVAAYDYLIDLREKYNNSNGSEGALIVSSNFSAGVSNFFGYDFPIWCSMYDKMGEVGILTASAVDNSIYDVDMFGDMPTTCQSDYLITVTNSTQNDMLDAAFGTENVDIAAPGESVFTTDNDNGYHTLSGSSLSTPHVTGAIALLYASACPDLIDQMFTEPDIVAETMKNAIMSGSVDLPSMVGKTVSEGRLDLFESVKFLQENCGGSLGELNIIHKTASNYTGETSFIYETPDFISYNFQVVDAIGRIVYFDVVVPPAFDLKEIKVNTTDWPSGIYYYTIFNEKSSANGSFFKL